MVVIASWSVADFIVELSVTVGEAKVAVGWEGESPRTLAVRITVPLKFMILVRLTVEEAVPVGPRVTIVGVAKTTKSGPITWTSTNVELERLPLIPVTWTE